MDVPFKHPPSCPKVARPLSRSGKEQAGRGGCNMEFLFGLAIAMAGEPDAFAVAGDSDGIDGHRRRHGNAGHACAIPRREA